ncbi:MAG: coproporphyrinogen III oxidase [Chloroflexi bacterium HGW-Chloroflexi-4]|jgi:oxygen-independent coproporphyrinogen-3 oxidase|nr:MAG: coproporphyrinogen III oxidase [Chloroflexi bacterium HGW-Chloroflexi-4]
MNTISLYFHVPFCNRRCGYCDFNTFAGMKSFIPQYVDAVCNEIKMVSVSSGQNLKVGTIFFGGGTPSLLSIQQYKQLFETCRNFFDLSLTTEITIEANPGTVNRDYLAGLHDAGINRISFGMQSAHPDDLHILDRQHHHEDVINAVAWSKQAGFNHINLDLIFGIPGQSLERWEETLNLALAENIDHFSLYSLIVEEGTPMHRWVARGLLQGPDDDLAADMYEIAMDRLEQADYLQYEISNWAKRAEDDNRCQHNLQYWRFLPYFGFGAGAHGFVNGIRNENTGAILEYIRKVNQNQQVVFPTGPAGERLDQLSTWDLMQEFLMVGFRLTDEGVSQNVFQTMFGHNLEGAFGKQINYLVKNGLIEPHPQDKTRLRLTRRGRLFGNNVFAQFVGNPPLDSL